MKLPLKIPVSLWDFSANHEVFFEPMGNYFLFHLVIKTAFYISCSISSENEQLPFTVFHI